ncbi:arsenate reductase ArsC [Sphingopyxis sp. JAI128]|uniref:arsenate reductase ArsC n=1 Tax=Sphingopyxis sp. JAI128 TaxID=2723066 RepID=UPI0016089396|nr:arsenate reductase ArsC [Sphingopyxis sp. JAI128]MBB6424622.1 protein-tyrosine-phosphatase [Sphingopyxis sp. JAI128]
MTQHIKNVLFLCTGNSARSILGEALLNRQGGGRFRAFSAGSFPKGDVHPAALELLGDLGFDTVGLRSKSWGEFSQPGAPKLDFIFTVCQGAADETCPIWPGNPVTAHWGIEDPAAVEGAGQREAFERALHYLSNRVAQFLVLPHESIDAMAMERELKEIGRGRGATQAGEANP